MKKNADDHGGQGASDYYKDINKKIATDIQQDQTFRSNIDNNFEQLIVQDIKNLLPKDLANKSKDQAEREVMANINRDSLNIKRRPITGFRG
jgi:3'-phosphoadenosine 5'-phosphosulfate (PAPS) 3'-phosphatase